MMLQTFLHSHDADHLTRAADDRIVNVEQTVTEMMTMMAKVLKAIGVKEN